MKICVSIIIGDRLGDRRNVQIEDGLVNPHWGRFTPTEMEYLTVTAKNTVAFQLKIDAEELAQRAKEAQAAAPTPVPGAPT